MASNPSAVDFQSIRALFTVGTVCGLTDRQLLEQFTGHDGDSAELAFTSLVERHGPMVLRVCRRVLRDSHEAEDAFQATFLILALKAKAIRGRDSLASWLYSVAYNVAATARSSSARRRLHELSVAQARSLAYTVDVPDDLDAVIHEELNRMPEPYRAVIVLCYFEGLTQPQAAQQLGWPLGTVQSRLARGRERLRSRLARRGLDPTAALTTLSPLAPATRLALPAALASSTVRLGLTISGARVLAIGIVPAGAINLVRGALTTMFVGKLRKAGMAALSAAALISTGAAVYYYRSVRVGSPDDRRAEAARREPTPFVGSVAITELAPHAPPVVEALRRGALRIARLKHAGDWNIARQTIPEVIGILRPPASEFAYAITQKDLFARDPNLIYYPLVYMSGRAPFEFDAADVEALREHLGPGGGTLFADAACGSAAFDAAFRRLVAKLVPGQPLMPISSGDDLFSARVGYDLRDVEYTPAAGGGRGYPQLDGVRLNGHWAIIYSKYDISLALDGRVDAACKVYTRTSAAKIAANVMIYSTMP